MVPPSVFLGFDDHNRFMWNCPKSGKIMVRTGYISPDDIEKFIKANMTAFFQNESLIRAGQKKSKNEDTLKMQTDKISLGTKEANKISAAEEFLFCPRYFIKLLSRNSMVCTTKVYYRYDTMISDALNFWSSHDVIIQPFIRQRHVTKPSMLRYYMRSNQGVYKADCITNSHIFNKESTFYKYLEQALKVQYKDMVNKSLLKHEKYLALAHERRIAKYEAKKNQKSMVRNSVSQMQSLYDHKVLKSVQRA